MSRPWYRSARLPVPSCKYSFHIKHKLPSFSFAPLTRSVISAFLICDRIGRIWATRELCIVWIIGIAIFLGNNGNLGAVYAGRFIAGLGVGQTPVVGPVYIAEIAPASVRGLCTCIFTGFVYLGIVLAYFANYGAQLNLGDVSHIVSKKTQTVLLYICNFSLHTGLVLSSRIWLRMPETLSTYQWKLTSANVSQ